MGERQELAELMTANILELGKFSYSLQEKREESLINQSGRILIACSINAGLLPLMFSQTAGAGLALLSASLLISIVFAAMAGWCFKAEAMPSVDVFFDEVYDRWEEFTAQPAFDMQWKYQLAALHESKKKNNDKRAICILISTVSLMCSLVIAAFLI